MKILYVATQHSPLDLNAGSGSDYQFYHAFLRGGAQVEIVGPFTDHPGLMEKLYRKFHRLVSQRRYAKFSLAFLRASAREVSRAIDIFQPDIVFAKNTAPLVHLNTSVPLIYRMDTTLKGSQDQWPLFSQFEYRRMLGWEQSVLKKCSGAITCSQWSADILHQFYGLSPAQILVVPNPASLPEHAVAETMEIQTRPLQPLNLLLVGREYKRKGVDIAIRTAELLDQAGVPVQLRIVGLKGDDTALVRYMGVFNKTIEGQLQQYIEQYRWAHFLLHPARFEAAGIVPGEAAAFGVPTLTNASGGLATTVEDGVSGVVLPKDSPAEAYVGAIQRYLAHPQDYLALCRTSRKRYEELLNWDVAGRQVMDFMQQILERSKRP